jgi:ATP-dependent Clp protease ATP-binding subunit ClpX
MLIGPSGCGKTYLGQTLSKLLNLPYLEVSARGLSNEGYKGMSFTSMVESFYKELPASRKRYAKHAIVFIDEFDKLCLNSTNDGWDAALQHSILKYVEGAPLMFPESKGSLDTSGMLFIFGGNFQGIREKVRIQKSMGFSTTGLEQTMSVNVHEELIKAGVLQELAGRISIIGEVEQLSHKQLKQILTKVTGSIYEQYQSMFEEVLEDTLELSPYKLDKIVDVCETKKIGARGLHSALDDELMKDLFQHEVDLTKFTEYF